jgi:hypothetical protein
MVSIRWGNDGQNDKPHHNHCRFAPDGRGNLTSHGFRSTFRDWVAERTNFPAEVAEMALTHAVTDKVEAAYRRGDLFQKRRQIMDPWARYCTEPRAGRVVDLMPIRTEHGEQPRRS